MQYTVFKPNHKNTGGLLNLKVAMVKNNKKDAWEKTLFAEFVPQRGWNEKTRSGNFDPSKKRIVAINVGEAGEFLHCMQENIPFQNYHQSGDRSCWIKFAPYLSNRVFGKEGDKGFWKGTVNNFAIGYSEKGQGVTVSLTPGEAYNVKLLLESYIKESMAIDAKEAEKKFKASQKSNVKNNTVVESNQSDDEEDEFFDDDIPFS